MARRIPLCTARGCHHPRSRGQQFCLECFKALPGDLRDRVAKAWAQLHLRDKRAIFSEARKWLAAHPDGSASRVSAGTAIPTKVWWHD